MKIITIIGARPQIIKASAISRTIKKYFSDKIEEIILHTGQHYDENMSEIFFKELEIPAPKYQLSVGSGKHGEQTAKMIEKIEQVLETEKPNAIIVYGDTNSTLAGAIAASKIHIPIVHIEAGLRSFDKSMPEEINRILCDHCSTLLFSPTIHGYNNLLKEGFSSEITNNPSADKPNIFHCGDIMYDNTLYFSQKLEDTKSEYGNNFILCTIHRNTNTDDKERLKNIFDALLTLSEKRNIVLPLHPRTKKMLPQMLSEEYVKKIYSTSSIKIIEPVSFLEMIKLESSAEIILTDSGGVQKEAFFLKKPCVILRSTTEWKEIVEVGNAAICDANYSLILEKTYQFLNNPPTSYPPIFGDGQAAKFICEQILKIK